MDWVAAVFEPIGIWLLANKDRRACYMFLICQVAWTITALKNEVNGLLFVMAVAFVLNIRVWIKWSK